ncbi:hypothetical protein [Sphingomonas sp. SAFR-052]|uniref:hypothetical protein n=1 Tax=Sphingomonas sp. SAFR-052 TaxID=3436867 RepID=UPI003F810DFE
MLKSILIKLTYKNLIESLKSYGQILEKGSRQPLFELVKCMVECLFGGGNEKYYLASLDPGSGKTEAIISFVNAWKKIGFDPKAGIVIAVSSLDQIKSIIDRAKLGKDDFACITSDDDLNMSGVGLLKATTAPILFTSHKMIRTRTSGKLWSSAKEFYFNGQVRRLKIWDEGLVYCEPLTIPLDHITTLAVDIEIPNRAFADTLKAFVNRATTAHGSGIPEVAIPKDIVAIAKGFLSTQRGDGKRAAIPLPRRSRATLESLARSANQPLSIKAYSGAHNRVLVGAVEPLPDDFAPAIILDASGRTRTTYSQMDDALGNLVRLAPAVHDYRNLDIQLHRMNTGKSALVGEDAVAVFKLAAGKISAKPKEAWLIIGPKADESIGLDIESSIKDALPLAVSSMASVSFLHWGAHTATNRYKDIKNIIIIGGNCYNDPSYDALEIASTGCAKGPTFASTSGYVRKGEFKSHSLQAVMRGNARNITNGACGECELHILVPRKFTKRDISDTFPGAKISDCTVHKLKKGTFPYEVFRFVAREMFLRGKSVLPKSEVIDAVGCSKNHMSKVMKNPTLSRIFSKLGVSNGNKNFVRSAST